MCYCLSPNKTGKQILFFVSDYEETDPEDGTTFLFELPKRNSKQLTEAHGLPIALLLSLHSPHSHYC